MLIFRFSVVVAYKLGFEGLPDIIGVLMRVVWYDVGDRSLQRERANHLRTLCAPHHTRKKVDVVSAPPIGRAALF